MSIRNFVFHRVTEERDPNWPPMLPQRFEQLIKIINKRYKIVLPEIYYIEMTERERARNAFACIHFDDGYKDNLDIAAPILAKQKAVAIFHLVTDCITSGYNTWTYSLDFIFQASKKENLDLRRYFQEPEFAQVNFGSPEHKRAFCRKLKYKMKFLSHPQRLEMLDALKEQLGEVEEPNKMMNWSEANQLRTYGFSIGSHTHTHPVLSTLTKDEEIYQELKLSYNEILSQTRKPPACLSYPNGFYDARVLKHALEVGYQLGFAIRKLPVVSIQNSLFELERTELYQESMWKTRLRMSGLLDKLRP